VLPDSFLVSLLGIRTLSSSAASLRSRDGSATMRFDAIGLLKKPSVGLSSLLNDSLSDSSSFAEYRLSEYGMVYAINAAACADDVPQIR
jgi:hypothetical protein